MRKSKLNPYLILGLQPGAAMEDVKSAYRRLAFEHHPDRNKEDLKAAIKFRCVARAYETIQEIQKTRYLLEPPWSRAVRAMAGIVSHDEFPTVLAGIGQSRLAGILGNPAARTILRDIHSDGPAAALKHWELLRKLAAQHLKDKANGDTSEHRSNAS